MAEMGYGYGSECHLLRYLGRHRTRFDQEVRKTTGADAVTWLDHNFDASKTWLDAELTGLNFLDPESPVHEIYKRFWPVQGPHWDAVARIERGGTHEWLLVEAKANLQELKSSCKAKKEGGLNQIIEALNAAKNYLQVEKDRDWLNGYYQYCNRIATRYFLQAQCCSFKETINGRLLFVYFLGDRWSASRKCPENEAEWQKALREQKEQIGLGGKHPLSDRVHELFLEVCPTAPPVWTSSDLKTFTARPVGDLHVRRLVRLAFGR